MISHEEIAALAFSYWRERGCQGGTAAEDWLRGERELIATAAEAIPTELATSACSNLEMETNESRVV